MVSVIIPTYKRAEKIDRAINSVLNQTYKDIEVIVVDDNDNNSEDRIAMEENMKKYISNDRVTYIKHRKNKNGAAARNTGIEIAKGEYITFLDDDDYFKKERIEKIIKCLKENKEYSIAYTNSLIYQNGNVTRICRTIEECDYKRELLSNRSFIGTGSNIFVKTDAIRKIGGFDESFIRHQDIEVLIRLLRNNKIIGINECLVVKDNGDRTNQPDVEKFLKVKEHFLDVFKKDIEEYDDKDSIYFDNYYYLLKLSLKEKKRNYTKKIWRKVKKYKKINYKEKVSLLAVFLGIRRRKNIIINRLRKDEKEILEEFKIYSGKNRE